MATFSPQSSSESFDSNPTPLPSEKSFLNLREQGTNVRSKHSFMTWINTIWALVAHFILSVGITIFVLVYIEGHHFNITERTPSIRVNGETKATPFLPMQSDIVTLFSAIIAVLKFALGGWAASLCWRIALFLMERRGLARQYLKILLDCGQLAPGAYSRDWSTWIIGILLLATLAANFSSPLISGSISWVPGSQLIHGLSLDPVYFDEAVDGTLERLSDLYLSAEYERQRLVLVGAGMTSIGWGRDTEKGILKRVSTSVDTISVNSTLENITMPYFEVHSIRWIEDPDEIPEIRDNGPLSVLLRDREKVPVGTDLFPFGSAALVPNTTLTNWSSDPLESMTIQDTQLLMLYSGVDNDLPEPRPLTQDLPPGAYSQFDGHWSHYSFAWVTFSAGVGRCKDNQCLISSTSTIQNTTPIALEPHQLTYQARLMMPLVSFTLVAQNASIPSPWYNIDDYVEALLVRSYSASWTILNDFLSTGQVHSNYVPAVPALLGQVDRNRVYIWLAMQLLVTVLGVLFMIIHARLSRYPLMGDTSLIAFHLDTTAVPVDSSESSVNRVRQIEQRGSRLIVKFEGA